MPDKKTKKLKVLIALITHRHGENVYVGATKKELENKIYNFVAQYWQEFMKDRPIPKLKKAAISQYFDVTKELGSRGEFLTCTDDTIEVPA